MRLTVLLTLISCCATFLQAQTNLYSENFEGASNSFTLNTSDLGSVGGTGGGNYWIVNNSYTGGTGSTTCNVGGFPIPLNFTINNSPTQPAGITSAPTSTYMHIVSSVGVSSGVTNASFVAADGACFFAENYFTQMSNNISTVGYDSVELSFYWMCQGGAQSYGEVYYTVDNGLNWALLGPNQWNNQGNWTQAKVSAPGLAQRSSLRFGFRFVNQQTTSASEPSFSIDEINVNGFAVNSIAAPSLSGTSYCPGDTVTINYTANGAYNTGNVFDVQLSNNMGVFTTPTVIGSASSSASGTITAVIPLSAMPGTNYRIRVVASNPNTISPDNGVNLTIGAVPAAGTAMLMQDTICSGEGANVMLTNYTGTISWETSNDGTTYTSSTLSGDNITLAALGQSTYLRAIVSTGCGVDTTSAVFVTVLPSPTASFTYMQGTGLDVTFSNTGSTMNNISWTYGDGNSSTMNNPTHTYAAAGNYTVVLTLTNAFGCTASFIDTVNVTLLSTATVGEKKMDKLAVFPNPSSGDFQINFALTKGQDVQINLLDMAGHQLVQKDLGQLGAGEHQINSTNIFQHLPNGIYLLELISSDQRLHEKLIIAR